MRIMKEATEMNDLTEFNQVSKSDLAILGQKDCEGFYSSPTPTPFPPPIMRI